MEHRFRRMELKARAYRDGADFGTKFLTWAYDFFSDFGRSFLRPLRGLALLWGTFFIVYWLLGVIALAPPVDLGSKIESKLIIDAALLSADKLFPFGTSVDESALFSAKLLGADAGIMGVVAGVLGAIQIIFSGVLIFLCGLSVRTKLLIG
ncbi:MAG: hypothetical protein CL949_12515 [Erythrobacter sp.]|nr:hypothetical protein [Erythrobacter sp.]|tara:strand:- start:145 stop:597 length:453 start_codon:yes stop_codon:yes gene_type:complete